jgi:outer membrane protein OmpA-like peptidoglycan-associated protein
MKVLAGSVRAIVLAALAAGCLVSLSPAQDGKLKVHAVPPQAYVFVDGQALHESSRGAFKLSPGSHAVDIYNYGYKPASQKVDIAAGKTTRIDVTLDPIPGMVSGPWGCITIEGAARDAVLLNGKTPAFFVGHGDEFNNEILMKQELIVPPGKYLLTVLSKDKEVWSSDVEVPADQRVVIDIPKGVRKTIPWPRGEQLKSLPRFKAGVASAAIVVAKPTAQLTASKDHIDAGQSTQLSWTTTDAPGVDISGIGPVTPSGEKSVQLCTNTTYNLTATGPGGTATSSLSIAVNSAITADLKASLAEAHYRRIGDKVVEQPTATLEWSTSNTTAVTLDPLGPVDPSGSRTVDLAPQQTTPGPVDETVTYTLHASNCSGASAEVRTASIHLTGAIESPEEVKALETRLALHSVFFPTNLPRTENPDGGLVASQEGTLTALATDFKKYLEFKPDARLTLTGHADARGSVEFNKALSERRVARAKQFLVEQGVPEASIDTRGLGKEQELTTAQVKELVEQNPDLSAEDRGKVLHKLNVIVLAQNRRVDVTLSTTGEQSVRLYPFNAADSMTLLDEKTPAHGKKASSVGKTKDKMK